MAAALRQPDPGLDLPGYGAGAPQRRRSARMTTPRRSPADAHRSGRVCASVALICRGRCAVFAPWPCQRQAWCWSGGGFWLVGVCWPVPAG